tara:strand:- start:1175 stop:3067 length:1893 start_codon:yes stop_codon:yes gene_type:complete
MCGINGILFKKNNVEFEKIYTMNKMLQHRGPDQSGSMQHNNLLLGHTRLSILDLSEKGSQPMSNDGRYWIIYNGEVYNYLEIKEELLSKNYKFYSSTDTEVVLNAYAEWGEKCFEKFNGEWALAILDKKENNLIISRDGIGYKPCYIFENEEFFSFSSEIKPFFCLKKSLNFNSANLGIASESLFYSSNTIFENVSQLTQGRLIKIDLKTNKKHLIRWDFPLSKLPKISPSYKENSENYFDLLYQSTKLRLRSDVAVGTSLSGGLDSSAIFCLLNVLDSNNETDQTKLNLSPIIIDYKDMKSKKEALQLSQIYKRKSLVINDKEESIEDTKKIISKLETAEEFFMQYNLYRAQKERGLKISIDGHGSDEFLGYPHFMPELSVDIYNNLINNYNAIIAFGNDNAKMKFKKLFGLNDNISNEISFKATPNTTNYFNEYIDHKEYDISYQIINEDLENLDDYSYSLKFTYLISYCGWFQFFLNKWDRASMTNSIEVRMPFLDPSVRLFGLALNTEHKIKNSKSKSILRDSFAKYLPQSILSQNYKQGLTQHKFDFNSSKYLDFVKLIVSEKNFRENHLWDIKKISNDIKQNKNVNKIWRLCKYYLMLEGFKENFESIDNSIKHEESFNHLRES